MRHIIICFALSVPDEFFLISIRTQPKLNFVPEPPMKTSPELIPAGFVTGTMLCYWNWY